MEDVERVRHAIDLVDLIESFVPLQRSGSSFRARCPFHEEKTPSFHVFPQSQIFKCFGCGAAGDCFSFLQRWERVSFRESLEALAERAGITLQRRGRVEEHGGPDRRSVLACLEKACSFFQAQLARAPGSVDQSLQARGIGAELQSTWRIGFAPGARPQLHEELSRAGFSLEVQRAASLSGVSESGRIYDRFRQRITFPIRDVLGRVIAFGARLLPGVEEGEKNGPKYLNSSETEVFSKRTVLFGLDRLERAPDGAESPVIVMEGYTDVILSHGAGVRRAVATLGTSLSRDHAKLLRRHAPRALLVYDGDEAGLKAAERGVGVLLEEGLEVRILVLPDQMDPADFVLRHGGPAFQEVVSGGGIEFFDFLAERALGAAGGSEATPDAIARATDGILKHVAHLGSAIQREVLVRKIAARFGLAETTVARRLRSLAEAAEAAERRGVAPEGRRAGRSGDGGETASPGPMELSARDRQAAEELLAALLRDPSLLPLLRAAGFDPQELGFVGYTSVLDAALQCSEQGLEADVHAVTLRLGDSPYRTLPASLWASAAEDPEQAVLKALAFFRRRAADRRLAEIGRSIARAESVGDREQAAALYREKLEVLRAARGTLAEGSPRERADGRIASPRARDARSASP